MPFCALTKLSQVSSDTVNIYHILRNPSQALSVIFFAGGGRSTWRQSEEVVWLQWNKNKPPGKVFISRRFRFPILYWKLKTLLDPATSLACYHYKYTYISPCNPGIIADQVIWWFNLLMWKPGGRLSIKMSSYQCRDPHVKDKTV